MTDLDHKTFDIAEVLAGRTYPTDTVVICMDEKSAYELTRAEDALKRAELLGDRDAVKELSEAVEALKVALHPVSYRMHLTGISTEARKSIMAAAVEKFPIEKDMLGRPVDNVDADEYHEVMLWSRVITKVEAPSGAVSEDISYEWVKALRDGVPFAIQARIAGAIAKLLGGAAAGFEAAAQDLSFLSDASPEG